MSPGHAPTMRARDGRATGCYLASASRSSCDARCCRSSETAFRVNSAVSHYSVSRLSEQLSHLQLKPTMAAMFLPALVFTVTLGVHPHPPVTLAPNGRATR